MLVKIVEGLKWLEFELLADLPIIQASFTRHGGVSQGHLKGLNLGSRTGDTPENLLFNKEKISRALSISNIKAAKSNHGKEIIVLDAIKEDYPTSDGISTQIPDFGLMVTHADCQAAIFYDPIQHALANVHCGWRGNVQNIYAHTVQHMQSTYGSKASDLLVCISPSLGPEHAEFVHYRQELPEAFWQFQVRPFYFDLWAISEWQLIQAGILPHHIEIARIDTFANEQDYFSYRRSKLCGRQVTVCSLKNWKWV